MKRRCERCQATFECQPTAIEYCQCSQWQLSVETRTLIAKHYKNCLCASCLQQLGSVTKKPSFTPAKMPPKRH